MRQLVAVRAVELDHFGHLVRDEVHVLHREHRELQAHHAADLARPEAPAVDDVLGVDRALVGDDLPGAACAALERGDARLQVDLGAADAGGLRVGVRRAGGVEVAVGGIEHRADEVTLLDERQELLGLLRCEELRLESEVTRPAVRHLQPLHALGRIGQQESPRAVQAAGLPRDPLELVVEPDGVALELRDVRIAIQGVKTPGGVPRGAGRQLVALDEHDVLPAGFREVVEHAAADHPAADHDHPRLALHRLSLSR